MDLNAKKKILAISGSLREKSSNKALLKAAAFLIPNEVELLFYEDLGGLPLFNPDLDGETPPLPVRAFRALLKDSEGVLISTPEYAHGVPGSLKNALDWVVSSGELVEKPVALINASTSGGEFAQPQLIEILGVMSARVLAEASLMGPLVRKAFNEAGGFSDEETAQAVTKCLRALATSAETD